MPKDDAETADKPKRPVRIIVDELRDCAISVGYSTVIFRPGQVLDEHHAQLAREHNILIREG